MVESLQQIPMNLTVGTLLQNGKYILNQVLVQDGLSITFKATQTHLNKSIALKTIHPKVQMVDHAQIKQRLVEEARAFAGCQHPGLASVLDFFEEAGLPFVVMDYVAGRSLAEQVQSQGSLPEIQALYYIRQVGSALSLLHEHGLVHGSVKPEAMIQPSGAEFVVLANYGIANAALLTDAQAAMSRYWAIEQSQAQERVTAATDVYALAASLYFLVTGQAPTAASLRHQVPFISPRQLQPQLSPATEAAILNGLELQAQVRPQTIVSWLSLLPSSPQSAGRPSSNGLVPVSATGLTQAAAQSNGNGHASTLHAPVPIHTAPVTPLPATPELPSQTKPGGRMSKLVIAGSILAAIAGAGSGLALRVNGATGPGSTFFHTEQSFPPADHWPGTEPIAEPTAPTISEPPAVSSEAAPEPVIPYREPSYSRPKPPPVKEPNPVETAPPTEEVEPLPELTPDPVEPPLQAAPNSVAPPEAPSNPAPEPPPPTSAVPPPTSAVPPPAPAEKPANGA